MFDPPHIPERTKKLCRDKIKPTGRWVLKKEFMQLTGWSSSTINGYVSKKKIKTRKRGGAYREYWYAPSVCRQKAKSKTPEEKAQQFVDDNPLLISRLINERVKEEVVRRIMKDGRCKVEFTKEVLNYISTSHKDSILRSCEHTAWLAVQCFQDGESFSVKLNEIIGEWRAKQI